MPYFQAPQVEVKWPIRKGTISKIVDKLILYELFAL